jgi:hypothetical protein
VIDLAAAIDRLVLLLEEDADPSAMSSALLAVADSIHHASEVECDAGLEAVAAAMRPDRLRAARRLALAGGTLVEHGARPGPFGERLLELLPGVFSGAARLGAAGLEVALGEEESEGHEGDERGAWIGLRFVPEDRWRALREARRVEAAAWRAAEPFARAAVACGCRSVEWRARCKERLLSEERGGEVRALASWNGAVGQLLVLFDVLEGESLLVLFPDLERGFRVRLSGVADNYQLHLLLADLFGREDPPGWFRRSKLLYGADPPAPRLVAMAEGEGPPALDGGATGFWTLYAWTALGPQGQIADPRDGRRQVLGGTPAEIPAFEGQRVLVFGPPTYALEFTAGRRFRRLRARVELEGELTAEAVRTWLAKLGRAPAPAPGGHSA